MSRSVSISAAARWLPLAIVLFAGSARASSIFVTDQVFLGDLGAPVFTYGAQGEVTPSGPAYEADLGTAIGYANAAVQLHAHASIATSGTYVSGTNGRATATVGGNTNWTISTENLDGSLDGGTIKFHEKVDGVITDGDGSSIFASTVAGYEDDDGTQHQAQGTRFLTGQGPQSSTYDVVLAFDNTGPLGDLTGFIAAALSTNAVLANNEEFPHASVDADNTSEILGFGIYDAAGNYVPGYSMTTDFGPLLEYDTVPPSTGGVPEPSAWAMMVLGFAGLGGLLRRRKALAATA